MPNHFHSLFYESANYAKSLDRLLAAKKKAPQRRQKNVIDPFQTFLIASTLEAKDLDTLEQLQDADSAIGGISSAVGNFHQRILGSIPGWRDHDAGYDVENTEKKIIAEIKNKHNTMNTSSRENTINKLKTGVEQKGSGWKAYLVIIIPKKLERYDKQLVEKKVWEVDGATFYEMATGSPRALHDLFPVLAKILDTKTCRETPADIHKSCQDILATSVPK